MFWKKKDTDVCCVLGTYSSGEIVKTRRVSQQLTSYRIIAA